MDQADTWESWMRNAEEIKRHHPQTVFFAALEVDARGVAPFEPLIYRLNEIGGAYWTFSLDDGRELVTTPNRLRHITTGQNLVTDYCVSDQNVSHLLFMAADTQAPDDVIPRMLEMNHPIVAPFIPTYGLRGPRVEHYPYHVEDAMASAAAIFIARDVFRKIRWRWDPIDGSDDPCYYLDSRTYLGVQTYVRHDCVAVHYPEAIPAIEERGHDMRVFR